MISGGRLRKLKKGLPIRPEDENDKKIASRKGAKTLSLSKMRNKLFFTPTPTSPIKGEEFSLPSPGGRD
jgi:hypothetical protein